MNAPLSPKGGSAGQRPPGRSPEAAERLAKALRENLRKRRAQKAARQESDPPPVPVDGSDER